MIENNTLVLEQNNYDSKVKKILTILDADQSGTISLQELENLYPDAARSLISRFDLDHNGELEVEELKQFIDSNKLASEILNRLQGKPTSDVTNIFPEWGNRIKRKYTFLKKIGKGGFGTVWLCTRNTDEKEFACKIIEKNQFPVGILKQFHRRVRMMNDLQHPGIVEFYGGYETRKKLYVMMEPCTGGELYAKVVGTQNISERDCISWTKQILKVLKFCHENGVVHCDVKPENILFRNRLANTIKVINFGSSKVRRRHEWLSKVEGTPMYMAPECLDRHYTEKCDVWAVGIMAFEMLHGYLPFKGKDPRDSVYMAQKGLQRSCVGRGPHINTIFKLSTKACEFITALLAVDPSNRPDAEEALLHPWLTDDNSSNKELHHVMGAFKVRNSLSGVQKFIKNMIYSDSIKSWVIEDVKRVFHECDESGDGNLDWEEFSQALKLLSSEMSDKQAKKLFDILDVDHDHTVDIHEWIQHFAFEHAVKHDSVMWELCKGLDEDGDGLISFEEMELYCEKHPIFKAKMTQEMKNDLHQLFSQGPISYETLICTVTS